MVFQRQGTYSISKEEQIEGERKGKVPISMKWTKNKMVTEGRGTSGRGSHPLSSLLIEIKHRAVDGPL